MSIESLLILLPKYFLSAYYVPVTGLRAGDITINIKNGIFAINGHIYMLMYIYAIKRQSVIKRKNRVRG